MATVDPVPIDPEIQAKQLAQTFFDLSNAVDETRLRNFDKLSKEQKEQLTKEADALNERGNECLAAAFCAILRDIQPHLEAIKKAAKDAKEALDELTDIAKAVAIVDAAVTLVGTVFAHDYGSIPDNLGTLAKAIKG